jgi:F1F0 ATPase subunit 2
MTEILYYILALVAGLALGTLFFGGLWFTVKKAVTAKVPAVWIIGGFIIRTSITLIGFYFVSLGSWQRLLMCLLGFVVARMLVMKFTKTYEQKRCQSI